MLGFTRELDAGAAAALDAADKALSACGMDPAAERPGQRRLTQAMILEPGKSATLAKLEGPRAITGIRIKVDLPPSPADGEALRELRHRHTLGRGSRAKRLGAPSATSSAQPPGRMHIAPCLWD